MLLKNFGIVSWGAYIPRYRVSLEEIGKTNNNLLFKGYKAIHNYDEDPLTMSIEALNIALHPIKLTPSNISLIIIGINTNASSPNDIISFISSYLGIEEPLLSSNVGLDIKSGTEALKVAALVLDNNVGKYGIVLGVGIDKPTEIGSANEFFTSSAVSAFVVSSTSDNIAVLKGFKSYSIKFSKLSNNGFKVNVILKILPSLLTSLLNELNIKGKEISYIAYTQVPWKYVEKIAKVLKINKEIFKKTYLYENIGCSGPSSALISLIRALEQSKEGDLILTISFDNINNVDVLLFETTNKIVDMKGKSIPLVKYLNNFEVIDYGTYIKYKTL